MYFKRILYFFYYLRELDWAKFKKFLSYASKSSSKTYVCICLDIIFSSLRYNISILDYFYFRFYAINATNRKTWAGTGFMYEFQMKMNPKGVREVLENKILFLTHFKALINRKFFALDELKCNKSQLLKVLAGSSGLIVLKGSRGQIGEEVQVISYDEYSETSLIHHMESNKFDLAEEYVVQHPALMELSSSGLNTVRIITQLVNGGIEIIAARLRISLNSVVDNLAAGNLAAPIDINTGTVCGPGIYSDITKGEQRKHPVTGLSICGFMIPHWIEVTQLAVKAALIIPENKSVGWDIAITESGPELIEGNHNWCKLLWQLPVNQGLKSELEKYL
jgi:hypothetical protein